VPGRLSRKNAVGRKEVVLISRVIAIFFLEEKEKGWSLRRGRKL